MKRYERFADDIAELIRSGVLGPGQRVPSVRYASQTHGVSPSTVFQAYYLLERRGLIRARPRSGYFVNAHAPRQFSEPQALQPVSESTDVDVSGLVFSILDSIKDPNTIPFGSAFPSPELFPLQRLSRSLASASRSMDPRMVVTDLSPGNPQLRRQIALRYMVGGLMLPMEELLITNGALEALNLCLQAVTQPGDLVAIEAPAFYACLQVLERLKLKAVEIPVHPREGMDLGVLAQTLEKHPVKAVWCMTNFQNPVGASMPEAKKQALVELLARHQVPLIEDDVYAELYYSQQAPKPAKAFDTQGLVMHCGSFAKSLAPGYRIGWVAAGRFAQKIERLKLMTSLCASMPAQAAIADYLQHGGYDRHLRKLRYALEGQQANMLAAIARHFPAQTRVSQPSGGYFLWLELPEQMDALKLFHMALAQGISIAPGPIFSPTRRFGNCIRLNYGSPWHDGAERAMETLGRIIRSF
ncbi:MULTISPECIES: GntR family transcriptional regulator MpaR [Pseudomonas]|jgi:DNA-binding transcriptional MocR family regulator|uniref:Aminotransferase class I/II-fold pyridoxal phosphate-dependent enzyme n=2 Tax=Pseudomonas putida TaxID=303 RepID=A0A1X0ZB81_PSEPU|nr:MULTISPECIES: GntR family transcriptional regulator MpaR [Pseudomonas]EKT4464319.1 PLP-dependent aminotransferase family protein [Pseudomonas putida]EKT4555150.1 PLP-dependent aminotransferase family protein [Pseudomonas putida]ELF6205926.1 PLP-dependent aminotransferase family protein [Pseudomonas putida]ELU0818206.1 PLP-dependent aminotransferase family protein [Pseudomonas putida]KAF0255304.1 aminotransferase class I/II-fold pyridoxal phosphate-dependent enzyme [Pseudomonas putida]